MYEFIKKIYLKVSNIFRSLFMLSFGDKIALKNIK